jgi:hypothetical protein
MDVQVGFTTTEKIICSGSKLSSVVVSDPLLIIQISSGSKLPPVAVSDPLLII